MDKKQLDKKSRELEKRFNKLKSKPLIAVRLGFLKKIIQDLDSNEELKEIFGSEPTRKMALVYDTAHQDFLIADEKIEEIDNVEEMRFLKILQHIIDEEIQAGDIKLKEGE